MLNQFKLPGMRVVRTPIALIAFSSLTLAVIAQEAALVDIRIGCSPHPGTTQDSCENHGCNWAEQAADTQVGIQFWKSLKS